MQPALRGSFSSRIGLQRIRHQLPRKVPPFAGTKIGANSADTDRTSTDEQKAQDAGSLWTWAAIDADFKLIIRYLCGRDASSRMSFMEDLA
jgi:hypothetical protein